MELKDRITEIRKSYRLTQKEFGEKIGVAANTVTNYESGNRIPLLGSPYFPFPEIRETRETRLKPEDFLQRCSNGHLVASP